MIFCSNPFSKDKSVSEIFDLKNDIWNEIYNENQKNVGSAPGADIQKGQVVNWLGDLVVKPAGEPKLVRDRITADDFK